MVAEVVEGVLAPGAMRGASGIAQVDAVGALTLGVFDRYPMPAALDAQTWERTARRARATTATDRAASAEARDGRAGAVPPTPISS